MGTRGPVPKRSEEVAGHHRSTEEITKIQASGEVPVPELLVEDPHPVVVEFWKSLKNSAQSQYYEESDWAYALWILHFADKQLKSGRPSSQMVAAVNSAFTDLLVSEGARRRVQMEIERSEAKASVVDLAELFKQRMQNSS